MARLERDFKFELGQKVHSKINGFTGIVVGRTEWLYGCVGYTVAPDALDKDGNPRDSKTFDEDTLELVETIHNDTKIDTGGPVAKPPAISR